MVMPRERYARACRLRHKVSVFFQRDGMIAPFTVLRCTLCQRYRGEVGGEVLGEEARWLRALEGYAQRVCATPPSTVCSGKPRGR